VQKCRCLLFWFGYTSGMLLPIRLTAQLIGRVTLRGTLTGITLLAWALWFGATIAVFVFVKHFFAVFPHEMAGTAANAMFNSFANYELILAGTSLLSSGMLLVTYPTARWVLILGFLILTAGMAVTVALGLIPMMDALIDQGKQHSPEFIKLHVKSMVAMTLQSVMLLLTGGLMLSGAQSPATPVADLASDDSRDTWSHRGAGARRGL